MLAEYEFVLYWLFQIDTRPWNLSEPLCSPHEIIYKIKSSFRQAFIDINEEVQFVLMLNAWFKIHMHLFFSGATQLHILLALFLS
jgi:hypothetical protein